MALEMNNERRKKKINLHLTREEVLKLAENMLEHESFAADFLNRLLKQKEEALKNEDLKALLNQNASMKNLLQEANSHLRWVLELERQILKENEKD